MRRRRLERLLADAAPPISLTPPTRDPDVAARWLRGPHDGGIDGVVAKAADGRYQPGKRSMLEVKVERTAAWVVAGVRLAADRPVLGSLVLGLYDSAGALRHVGVATSFHGAAPRRAPRRAPTARDDDRGASVGAGFGLERQRRRFPRPVPWKAERVATVDLERELVRARGELSLSRGRAGSLVNELRSDGEGASGGDT